MSRYPEPYIRIVERDYARLGIEKEQCLLVGESIQERKRKLRSVNNMEIPVKEHKVVLDGQHEGKITAVIYRHTPLEYTDYNIQLDNGLNIKASYPTNLTPETIHGRMLLRFGMPVHVGSNINPDNLVGIKCVFTTVNHATPKGTFPEVMRDSLKPAPIRNPNAGIEVGSVGHIQPSGFVAQNPQPQQPIKDAVGNVMQQ